MNENVLKILGLVLATILVIVIPLVFLLRYLMKNNLIFYGGGFALDPEEGKRALKPRSMRCEEEKRKSLLKSIPFFCVSILFWVLALIDANLLPIVYFYSPLAAFFGVFVMRYRKSYYDAKGKMLRNIIDLIEVSFIAFSPVVVFITGGFNSFVFGAYMLVVLIAVNVLKSKLKKCDVIKPEEDTTE